jgi:hypothetical protein
VKAFTGPPDQERQDRQWQYPIALGLPLASTSTRAAEAGALIGFTHGFFPSLR